MDVATDDHAAVLLRFDAGIRGAFHVSQVTAGRKNRLTIEIAATEASAWWDSESPDRLWIGSRRGPNQLLARDPALLGPAASAMAHYPGGHVEGFPDTFKQLYIDVYGWIDAGPGGRPPPRVPDLRRRRSGGPALRGDRPQRRRRPMGRSLVASDGWHNDTPAGVTSHVPGEDPAWTAAYTDWATCKAMTPFGSAAVIIGVEGDEDSAVRVRGRG